MDWASPPQNDSPQEVSPPKKTIPQLANAPSNNASQSAETTEINYDNFSDEFIDADKFIDKKLYNVLNKKGYENALQIYNDALNKPNLSIEDQVVIWSCQIKAYSKMGEREKAENIFKTNFQSISNKANCQIYLLNSFSHSLRENKAESEFLTLYADNVDLIWDDSHKNNKSALVCQTQLYADFLFASFIQGKANAADLIEKINKGFVPSGYDQKKYFWLAAAHTAVSRGAYSEGAEYAQNALNQRGYVHTRDLASLFLYRSMNLLMDQNYDEAIKNAEYGLKSAAKLCEGELNYVLFMAYSHQNRLKAAFLRLTEGKKHQGADLSFFKSKLDFALQCARTYHAMQKFSEAIQSAEEGVKIVNDADQKLKLLGICALCYKESKNPKKAAETYAKAFQLLDAFDIKTKIVVAKKYCNYLLENGQFDDFLSHALKACDMAEKASLEEQKAVVALMDQEIQVHFNKFKDQKTVAEACLKVAQFYKSQNEHEKALQFENLGKGRAQLLH